MLSAGLPENHGLGGWRGEVEGVGWLSVPWGWKSKVKGKNKNQKGRAVPLGTPIQYSLAPIKRAQSWVGGHVDYKGGGSCRMVDVGVFLGRRGTR